MLLFAPGEQIALPDEYDEWSFLVLRGEAVIAPEAARTATSLEELCDRIATEIQDQTARAQFLRDLRPDQPSALPPGLIVRTKRSGVDGSVWDRRLHARGEVTVLVIPPSLKPQAIMPLSPPSGSHGESPG